MGILNRSESRRGATVRLLAVHTTEGNDSPRVDDAAALRDATWWTGSSHAIADNDPGSLLTPEQGCVPYERAAWTLRSGNRISDNIEQVGWARWTREQWLERPKLLDNTARWLADRSRARGIPLVKLSPADVAAGKWGVIGHVDWTLGMRDGSHTDPGPNYPWDVVLAKATAYRNGTPQEDDMPSAEEIAAAVWNRPIDGLTPAWQVVKATGRNADPAAVREATRGHAEWAVATLEGRIAGLEVALKQAAAAPASELDLDAVFKAAQDGARSIVDNLRVVAEPTGK